MVPLDVQGASEADREEKRQALLRNDRYLTEFIEALAICPYAKSCRETGRLYREVRLESEPDATAMAARIRELQTEAPADMEVGLIILPRLKLPAQAFERFVSNVQRSYQQGGQQSGQQGGQGRGQPTAFFVVAFHPELAVALHNPDVAVRFMRHSPDPTIQLVRPQAIERVRGERSAEVVSRQIAEAGLRAVLSHGPDKLGALLDEIRASYR